eukprot:CAMPEP_0196570874 /NCGR_PEP_ID=MMETSP1081-20130531/1044_1 /TAXON_ID=36882 /ORGANISM="Pyramimonas amylifera, Strain CCMP720" /LENGTH=490 /DNA_ID=CAMNT_0041887555 /DNA_START=80 /DNA_END=1552 /DNA_ORIENTATION=-
MARLATTLLFFSALFVYGVQCSKTAEADASDVHTVSGNADFEALVAENDFVVVEFYAPWCGHCKKLAPEWEKAATTLKEDKATVKLAKCDATEDENKDLATRFDIKGYPTLKIFRNGDTVGEEYKGPREAEGIVKFLKKQSGPASVLLTSKDQVEDFLKADAAVVGLLSSLEGSKEFDAFTFAAKALREDLVFAHTTDASILDGMTAPSVVLFKTYDDPKLTYEGAMVGVPLVEWLNKKSLPIITELDQTPKNRDALRKLFASPLPKAIFFAKYESEGTEEMKEALRTVAQANEGEMHFVQADASTNEGALKFFGMTEEQLPSIVVHDTAADLKYVNHNVQPGAIASWINDFKAGKVEVHVKSEEIPEPNDEAVVTVVGKNFKELVDDTDKDVFIEFYAPWCGHCKKLAPIWEEVAEHFKDNSKLVIAKMDSTANDVSSKMFTVKGFPTLYYKKAGESEAISYSGDRSKADLINFVNKHATSMPISKEEL